MRDQVWKLMHCFICALTPVHLGRPFTTVKMLRLGALEKWGVFPNLYVWKDTDAVEGEQLLLFGAFS